MDKNKAIRASVSLFFILAGMFAIIQIFTTDPSLNKDIPAEDRAALFVETRNHQNMDVIAKAFDEQDEEVKNILLDKEETATNLIGMQVRVTGRLMKVDDNFITLYTPARESYIISLIQVETSSLDVGRDYQISGVLHYSQINNEYFIIGLRIQEVS